jgi:hypothetical protein
MDGWGRRCSADAGEQKRKERKEQSQIYCIMQGVCTVEFEVAQGLPASELH